jgi:hypothetical protein
LRGTDGAETTIARRRRGGMSLGGSVLETWSNLS